MTGYKRISDYGLIGNMLSAALVGIDGSIDWACFPHFDSPSVFASLLDSHKGGHFSITPSGKYMSTQSYQPLTNILQTSFETPTGTARLTDFMPCHKDGNGDMTAVNKIVRRVECTAGNIDIELSFEPRLDYARGRTRLTANGRGVRAANGKQDLFLASRQRLEIRETGAFARFGLSTGERFDCITGIDEEQVSVESPAIDETLRKTAEYWSVQARGCGSFGPWDDHLVRSYLALHLMMYLPTGAMVAAPTTSLPEWPGGECNWDYRFSWLRDTSLAVETFGRLGHLDETHGFLDWLLKVCRHEGERPHTLFSIELADEIPEKELSIWRGIESQSRCASATRRSTRCNWIPTERSSTLPTNTSRWAAAYRRKHGMCSAAISTRRAVTGPSRTTASRRSGRRPGITCLQN